MNKYIDTKLIEYSSIDEYAAFLLRSPNKFDSFNARWDGGPFDKAIKGLTEDYTVNAEKIQNMIDEMQMSGIFTTGLPMPENHYFGSKPNIVAYLSGLPKTMRRRSRSDIKSISSPIGIYLDVGTSAGVTDELILKRGVAVCALAMALKTVRPVSVYILDSTTGRDYTYVTKIQLCNETLDIGRMDFCFSTPSFARCLVFTGILNMDCGKENNYHIGWGWGLTPSKSQYDINMKKYAGITSNDIYITGSYLYNNMLMETPVEWVRMMAEKYQHENIEEETESTNI